jgi:hypothetical protein
MREVSSSFHLFFLLSLSANFDISSVHFHIEADKGGRERNSQESLFLVEPVHVLMKVESRERM